MADARISTALPNHPKTKKLVRRLGGDGGWMLIRLFLWAAENRTTGDLSGMSDEDIELAVDWTGAEGALVAALCEVGFLDGSEGQRSIHDWSDHNPWAASSEDRKESATWAALCKRYGRAGAAERMPEYAARMRRASEPQCEPHATRIESQCAADAPSPSPSPSPSPMGDAAARGARLPPDWSLPDAWREWAEAERPDLDVERVAADFADYWHAKSGKEAVKRDWLATWRRWVRNQDAPRRKRSEPESEADAELARAY